MQEIAKTQVNLPREMRSYMIFPDVPASAWCEKHPGLTTEERSCSFCKRKKIANIPFVSSNWVGFKSKDCICGKTAPLEVAIPRKNRESMEALRAIFGHNPQREYSKRKNISSHVKQSPCQIIQLSKRN